jgi:hypothetical protein
MTREKAVEIVRNIYQTDAEKEALAILVPELRESENERIIKTLQEYVKNRNWPLNGPTQDEVLAYLEKQKEQKPVERSLEDDHTIGFVYDLLNEIEWKDNWAMSKEECLRLLSNYIPKKPVEWSDEDSDNLERVDNYLWMLDDYVGDDCATPQGKADKIRENIQKVLSPWIKSLPERFNLQAKVELSEEDEKELDCIINVLDRLGFEEFCKSSRDQDIEEERFYYEEIQFLKRLKALLCNKNKR